MEQAVVVIIMEILKVENLVKTYGEGDNIVNAVDNISLSVNKGEFVAIVGASGSGKSTLLHLLGGVDRPTSGKIYIDGNEINNMNNDKLAIFRRRQIGIVYQFYNLIPILTVEENISLPCDLDGNRPDKERMDLILKSFGLFERRNPRRSPDRRRAPASALLNPAGRFLRPNPCPSRNLSARNTCSRYTSRARAKSPKGP